MAIEDTLATVELFADIDADDLAMIAKIVVVREFDKGEVIVREGEPGVGFYIISKGRAEVVKGLGTANEQVIATVEAGGFFGEMALFDKDDTRSASVRAVEPTECYVLSKWDLNTVMEATEGRVALALLGVLARRIRSLTDAATH
jgi:CRP/FNR family transcriptional regulator/CRP/FNR family cyclic AMP-dependent transcriptional regulator